jgi:DNA-binding HxlR family transcriptional regulator
MLLLGGAWTPNVIWHLHAGPRRFSELQGYMPRISGKVLTQRLRELERKGVISRHVARTTPPTVEYDLTELGRELLPAIEQIGQVGRKLKQAGGVLREEALS